jgi:hypothetical protein
MGAPTEALKDSKSKDCVIDPELGSASRAAIDSEYGVGTLYSQQSRPLRSSVSMTILRIDRVEYYYYRATVTHADRSRPVLVRRPKVPSPRAKVVELFAEVNLIAALGLKPGDIVSVDLLP